MVRKICDENIVDVRPGGDLVMNWNNFEMNFQINTEGELFSAKKGGETVASGIFADGTLKFSLKYDFQDKPPLTLVAKAKQGDDVKVHILPYRIELYVNGVLMDEEWPCGKHYLKECELTDNGCGLILQEWTEEEKEEPTVLGTFQNAEGWQPEENVFVGDCMPYSHEDTYHVLYLKDRHRHHSKWKLGAHQWSHISTKDFVNWDIHPMAVEIDDPYEGSICTGSWIYDGSMYYLFYTVRMCDGSPARICRSISEDGYHFKKDRDFSFTLSDKYTAPSARDPKVIKDAEGLYHMILTSSLTKEKNGCLVHLVSEDLTQWKELEDPLYIAPADMWEPECPDYFCKDGYSYLVYSLHGKGYYQYSKKPFSDWQMPKDPIIPCKSVPKAAIWNDRLIFAGFDGKGQYAGTMTFLEAVVQEDGQLKYKSLDE